MTIKDIAKESGYAISTVSRVLNNHADVSREARERIMAVVEANHFQLNSNAKHLKQRNSNNIAIVVKGTMNMLFSVIVEQMQAQIKGSEYTAVVHYLDEEQDEVTYAQQVCRERQPVGLVFLGGLPENFERGFGVINLPSVLVAMGAEELNFSNLSSVSVDDVGGAQSAINLLLEKGHREIGVIGGDVECSGPARLRLAGCQKAFDAWNIPFDATRQFEQDRFAYQSGYVAMCRLLERMPQMTAAFCMSDVMAIGAMRALADSGKRVPQDISVMGFDGIPVALFSIPRLATVQQDAKLLAQKSVEILFNCLQRGASSRHLRLEHSIICGESVAERIKSGNS